MIFSYRLWHFLVFFPDFSLPLSNRTHLICITIRLSHPLTGFAGSQVHTMWSGIFWTVQHGWHQAWLGSARLARAGCRHAPLINNAATTSPAACAFIAGEAAPSKPQTDSYMLSAHPPNKASQKLHASKYLVNQKTLTRLIIIISENSWGQFPEQGLRLVLD